MGKYRIKEYDFRTHKEYVIQQKSIFGFWYNPANINIWETECYDNIEEAKEAVSRKLITPKTKIVWEN